MVRPFRDWPGRSASTHLPRPRQPITSPFSTVLSPFRHSRWFTSTRPAAIRSAALPRDRENPAASSDGARSGRTAAGREDALFRPASYRQMLRNAQVHDRDGKLWDGENSVTPGVRH